MKKEQAGQPKKSSVSVALASCMGERYIGEQLDSIAKQTRPPDQLVISDDDSTDGTIDIVKAFQKRVDFEVLLVQNKPRLGTTKNFEQAVSLCDKDIIFLADQDDYWVENKIECQLEALDSHPEVGMVFSNGTVTDGKLQSRGYDLWQALEFTDREQQMVSNHQAVEVFLRRWVAAGTTMAFRSCYKPLLGSYPEVWGSTHDAWIAFMITAVSDCMIVSDKLILYRFHGNNQVGIHRFNLLDQYQQAKKQLKEGAIVKEETFFKIALEKLKDQKIDPKVLALIESKIDHCHIRNQMPGSLSKLPSRLPAIVGELSSGRYGRFAYGVRSMAQDILLR